MVAGNYIPSLELFPLNGLSASFDGAYELPLGTRSLYDTESALLGAPSDENPVSVLSEARSGNRTLTFFEDYYNRIWILPSVVDFGAIVGTETSVSVVWNSFLVSQTMDNISSVGADGLTVDQSAPLVFGPLQQHLFTYEASDQGAPELNATFTLSFTGLGGYSVFVTGTRAKIWDLGPNWSSSYKVNYEFRTDIVESRSGREQRRALRNSPRKTIEYRATAHNDNFRKVNRDMASWQHRTWLVEEYTREARLSLEGNSGSFTVTLASVPSWIIADQQVILRYGDSNTIKKVASVAGNDVTFTSALAIDWPAGSRLHPLLSAKLATSMASNRLLNNLADLDVRQQVIPASELPELLPEAPAVFDGREVFYKRPNWKNSITAEYNYLREELDYGRGVIAYFTPLEFGNRVERLTFFNRDREEAELLRQFFERMKGQRGEFYMPTWEADVAIKGTSPIASDWIRTEGVAFKQAYFNDKVFKAIAVLLNNGTWLFRKIIDIYEVSDVEGTDSVIQTDGTWPVALSEANVRMICLMPLWRHASDTMTTEWLTNDKAQVTLSVKTLEALPDDL